MHFAHRLRLGFDSIIAQGRTEPDPKLDTVLKLDGNDVVVPQGLLPPTCHRMWNLGPALPRAEYKTSSFSQVCAVAEMRPRVCSDRIPRLQGVAAAPPLHAQDQVPLS